MAEIATVILTGGVEPIAWTPHEILLHPGTRYRGNMDVTDFVSRAGVLGSYRVYLLDRETGDLIDRTVSAVDGSYSFTGLRSIIDGYLLVAVDNDPKADALNAAVADLITPGVP